MLWILVLTLRRASPSENQSGLDEDGHQSRFVELASRRSGLKGLKQV